MAKGEEGGTSQLLASASQAPLSLFSGTPARLSGMKDKMESEKETGAVLSHLENIALYFAVILLDKHTCCRVQHVDIGVAKLFCFATE